MDLKYKTCLGSSTSSDSDYKTCLILLKTCLKSLLLNLSSPSLIEIFKGLSHTEDLVCQSILDRDGGNIGIVHSPHDISLLETVKLLKKKGYIFLLLCITVLLTVTNTNSRVRLRLGVS
jgi:hypothetical protein